MLDKIIKHIKEKLKINIYLLIKHYFSNFKKHLNFLSICITVILLLILIYSYYIKRLNKDTRYIAIYFDVSKSMKEGIKSSADYERLIDYCTTLLYIEIPKSKDSNDIIITHVKEIIGQGALLANGRDDRLKFTTFFGKLNPSSFDEIYKGGKPKLPDYTELKESNTNFDTCKYDAYYNFYYNNIESKKRSFKGRFFLIAVSDFDEYKDLSQPVSHQILSEINEFENNHDLKVVYHIKMKNHVQIKVTEIREKPHIFGACLDFIRFP